MTLGQPISVAELAGIIQRVQSGETTAKQEMERSVMMKLYVVGESSGNPDEWDDDGSRRLVIASSPAEALALCGDFAGVNTPVTEVDMSKPRVIAEKDYVSWDSHWE